ncbi:hypothetical protein Rcae01_00408 [Novipirellula caenicola]|uniref:Uncharacterized protein n=1 Tax=Novipirellula caenicola TaxID=1536901 RepID=A0ABP9VID2_9BACT
MIGWKPIRRLVVSRGCGNVGVIVIPGIVTSPKRSLGEVEQSLQRCSGEGDRAS